MKLNDIALWGFLAAVAAAIVRLYAIPMKPRFKIPLNCVLSVALLGVFNYFSSFLGISIGVNPFSCTSVAFLGPAGLPVLLLAKWILNI